MPARGSLHSPSHWNKTESKQNAKDTETKNFFESISFCEQKVFEMVKSKVVIPSYNKTTFYFSNCSQN